MNVLPFVSADYKLIHLFIPLFLLFNDDSPDKYSSAYLFLFGLLLIPKHYFDYLLPSVLDPFIMIFIAILIVVSNERASGHELKASCLADGPAGLP
jgi:hypothetical protein